MIITIIVLIIAIIIAICFFKSNELERCFGFCTAIVFVIVAYLITPIIGYQQNRDLVANRPYIMAAIDSDDPEFREQAIQEAIEYNKRVEEGKRDLANPWINWFIDRIWADAEFIPLDYSTVTVKENS